MEDGRPVAELRELWRSPLLTFFYFMSNSLWDMITELTTRYYNQQVEWRAQAILLKQGGGVSGTGHRAGETLAQIRRRLKAKSAYETHEILHVIDLLVARAAAVVRNLKIALDTDTRLPWYLVVVDRFYLSILLGIELLATSVCVIGTIMTDRLGFDKNIIEKRKSRPTSIPRGTFTFSHAVAVPNMVAFHWWDRKPGHYLCTGSVTTTSIISRNIKRLGPITVPCPAAVNDYQRWMGGVDVRDQLHLQTFSLQTSIKFRKYYKSLFLGFVDLVLVSAYITHKEAARLEGTTSMKRSPRIQGLGKTCFAIWYDDFNWGQSIPASLGKKVVLRRAGKVAGKRKKTRRGLRLNGGVVDREEGKNDNDSDQE
ncbi:hypothetical protein ON010_g16654 [Phytophthora cinnamomi]|nr:hypothetical protein ON010_g16654 [Phytophthora cinnamomi]